MGNQFVSRGKRTLEELASVTVSNDCYETPPWVTRSILKRESYLNKPGIYIADPCAGRGAMAEQLLTWGLPEGQFRNVICSDIREGPEIYGSGGIDFLTPVYGLESVDAIVTNPPFGPPGNKTLGLKIIERSLLVTKPGGLVCVFIRQAFLESQVRYHRLWSRRCLRRIWQFVERPSLYPEGEVCNAIKGMVSFVWLVFDPGFVGDPTFHWIDDSPTPDGLLPDDLTKEEYLELRRLRKARAEHERDGLQHDAISEDVVGEQADNV